MPNSARIEDPPEAQPQLRPAPLKSSTTHAARLYVTNTTSPLHALLRGRKKKGAKELPLDNGDFMHLSSCLGPIWAWNSPIYHFVFCRVVTAAMFWMRSFSMMIFAHRSGYKSCLFIFLILPEPKLFLLKIVVTSSTCRMDWEIKKISQSHLAKLWQG